MNIDALRELARPILLRNRRMYDLAVEEITAGLERRNPLSSAALVQVAAEFAWRNHPGVFSSVVLENTLRKLSSASAAAIRSSIPEERRPTLPRVRARRVLHVLSEAYREGGHTRLVARWITLDRDSQHSVAVLRHPGGSLPAFLSEAISRSGGDCHRVDQRPASLLGRAKALSRISRDFDYMVVHTHPFDAVPSLAAAERGPTVMKVDNADHVFELGMQEAHAVLHTRKCAAGLAARRRGTSQSSSFILPIPLDPAERTRSRAEARNLLGVPGNDVLMLSIASPYKFDAYAGLDFIATHARFLEQRRHARLIVLGPSPSGPWKAAEERTQGRFRALGYVHDPLLYLQAADIAVESYPVGSITAVLEIASYGNPVISLNYAHTPEAQIIRTDDPSLEDLILLPNRENYEAVLDDIVSSRARRRAIGDGIGGRVGELHCAEGWRAILEKAYAFAKGREAAGLTDTAWRDDEIDLLTAGIHESCGISRSMDNIRLSHIGAFPLAERIRALRPARLSASTFKGLLPDWLRGFLSRLARGF